MANGARSGVAAALLMCAVAVAGCESSPTIPKANLSRLVLSQDDLPAGFSGFNSGPQVQLDNQGTVRSNASRFGREGGWIARFRRSDTTITTGPLVVESRADLFKDSAGAKADLGAYRTVLSRTSGSDLKNIPVTWIGPTRVNNDRSQTPTNRDCGRDAQSIGGNSANCVETNRGADQFFPFVTISTDGVLNVTFHDRRLDTDSPVGSGAWPTSKTEVGNYLVWYWGAQCKITHTQTVSQTTTGPVPSGASQCVAPEAVVNPTLVTGFDPGAGPIPGNNQNSATLPFRNFQISDVGSNFDYSFRAGIFAGDYSGNASGPTVGVSNAHGDDNDHAGNRDVIAVWTDARNGRGSGAPTSLQPGRNPICEQSDVFFKIYNSNNGGEGSHGRREDSFSGFLVAPCGGDMQERGVNQHGG